MKFPMTQIKYTLLACVFGIGLFAFSSAANAVTTTCSSDLDQPDTTYTLSGPTSNTCNITTSGVSLDGGGFTIGHTPTPFPDGGVNGWMDMTGNVLLYHMDDSSALIHDSSGNGNDGNDVNSDISYSQTGTVGTSLGFFGSPSEINLPNTPVANLSYISISAWVKATTGTTNYPPIFATNNLNAGIQFLITPQYDLGFGGNAGGNGYGVSTTGGLLSDNQWHLCTATYDGSNFDIYVDGVLQATTAGGGTLDPTMGGTGYAEIAGEPGNYFAGNIDELAVWDRALSPTEISNIYSAQSGSGFAAVTGNGYGFNLTNLTTSGLIQLLNPSDSSQTVSISNSTIATVNVSGADSTGDGGPAGGIILDNTSASLLILNGGNSTDSGYGGSFGPYDLFNGATATGIEQNHGHCGPNNLDQSCFNIFTNNNGNGDGDWDTASNWSFGYVPWSTDNVDIQANVSLVSKNDASVNSAIFSNSAVWDPNSAGLTLNAANNVEFHDPGNLGPNFTSYVNSGTINAGNNGITFFDDTYDYGGTLNGNAGFHGTSYLSVYATLNGIAFFLDSSHNDSYNLYGSRVNFENDSYNNGNIFESETDFYNSSYNTVNGLIYSGTIVFHGDSTEYTQGGLANLPNRYFDSDSSGPTTRDFTVYGQPWEITADGINLDVSGASCDSNTTVFNGINGGTFTYGSSCHLPLVLNSVTINSPTQDETFPSDSWAPSYTVTGGTLLCQYSYGDPANWNGTTDWNDGGISENWQSTDCSSGNGGLDIAPPAPSSNPVTLAIRLLDGGGNPVIASTVGFTYDVIVGPSISITSPTQNEAFPPDGWGSGYTVNNQPGGTSCQYSYGDAANWNSGANEWNDGGTSENWTTTDCSNGSGGSDIPEPPIQDGVQLNTTLAIRLLDGGGSPLTSATVAFLYGTNSSPSVTINWPTLNQQVLTTDTWSPSVTYGSQPDGATCQYSYGNASDWNGSTDWNDGGTSENWTTTDCGTNGSDIPTPAQTVGTTLAVRTLDVSSNPIVASTVTFSYLPPAPSISITSPTVSQVVPVGSWSPAFTTAHLPDPSMCQYSYGNASDWNGSTDWNDGGTSENWQTVDCSSGSSNIVAPAVTGSTTMAMRVQDGSNTVVATSTIAFRYGVVPPPTITIDSPTSNQIITNSWTPHVTWNQGQGGYNFHSCQYSFGTTTDWNGTSWSGSEKWYGTACTGTGSNIPKPTVYGQQILAIRGLDNSNAVATTSTQSFTLAQSRQLYFYKGSDANWSTVGNWFTDVTHSVPANSVPNNIDKVTILGTNAPIVNLDTWTQPSLINSGSIGVSFTSTAGASTTVLINGNATFNSTAVNHGTINGSVTFNGGSSNTGTVKYNSTFNATSTNTYHILGSAVFYGDTSDTSGTVSGVKTRYYNATTTTTRNLIGWTVVADGVTVTISTSTEYNTSTVFRTLNGGVFIGGPTVVYWKSNGSNTQWTTVSNWYSDASTTVPLGRVASTTESVITLGNYVPTADTGTTTWRVPTGIDASATGIILYNANHSSIYFSVTGSTTFSGNIINSGTISGNTTFMNGSANGYIGVISGNATFNNSSLNNNLVTGDVVFNDTSSNGNNGIIGGSATFNNTSFNTSGAGVISGTATFNDTSYNNGTIANDAVFYNNLTENNGTIQGNQTRHWNISTTTVLNFAATGPWTLIADDSVVTIDNSATFSTTTTFTTMNGGSFVGDSVPGSYTTCTKSLILPGTYTLNGDISNTCDIESNGVVIDGGGHTVGHTPLPLPDSASSNGWMDMTGNAFLGHMENFSGNGNSVNDSSGQGNNLTTIISDAPTSVSGLIDNALSFDGNAGITNSEANLHISSSDDYTLSTWVKDISGAGMVFSYNDYNYTSGQFNTWFTNNGTQINFTAGQNWGCQSTISGNLPDANNWHLITGTYQQGVQTLYIDGIQVAQGNYSCGQAPAPSQPDIGLGNGFVAWGVIYGYYTGLLDETALWTRALSPSEVTSMYTTQLAGIAITGNGYNFNINNLTASGLISSPGATIDIANSTVSTVDVSGANAAGDAQDGGTINLTDHSTVSTAIANGGNSTDYGFGGARGSINVDGTSVATSQTTNDGTGGPNRGGGQQNTGGSGGNSSPVSGCTDPSASNYNSNATIDNGSCRYSQSQVRGCTDPSATNYNVNATINDGSCHYNTYTPPTNGGNNNNNNNPPPNNPAPSNPSPAGGGSGGLTPIYGITIPVNTIPKLVLKPLPTFGQGKGSFSFVDPITHFLFEPLPDPIYSILKSSPKLSNFMAGVGLAHAQDLVTLKKNPISLPATTTAPGILELSSGTTTLPISLITQTGGDILLEQANLTAGQSVTISLLPLTTKGNVTATFNGVTYTFVKPKNGKGDSTLSLIMPTQPGRYIFSSRSAAFPLAINVATSTTAVQNVSARVKSSNWSNISTWFGKAFH